MSFFAVSLALPFSSVLVGGTRPEPLIHASDVRTLSPEAARRGLPVRLRAVITYVDATSGDGQLFIQDETAGIFVFLKNSRHRAPLRAGQLVEVDAVTVAGDFSPCLAEARITLIGEGKVPRPKRPLFDQFLATREDGQWTELRGVVRSGEIKGGRLFLNVAVVGGSFLAISPDFRSDWEGTLVDSVVSVTGALAPIRNQYRQAVGVRLFVPGRESIRIEQAAAKDPFDRPLADAATVGGFHPLEDFIRRIRVRVRVTAVESGTIYVSGIHADLAVQSSQRCNLKPGDLAEIAGFPGLLAGRPGLLEAVCRKLTGGTAAEVIPTSTDTILPDLNFTDPSGVGQAAGTRFDMKLVRIEGSVLQSSRGPDSLVLTLETGKKQFVAVMPGASPTASGLPESGDRVQLTGLCLITYDQYHRGQSFRLLLRSAADIVVKQKSPWWNATRALWAVAFMSVLILSGAAWIASLRHNVASKTNQLRRTNELLERLALEDPLTGSGNRRQFDRLLVSECDRTRRLSLTLSLLMIDIDHFKILNDAFGHLQGDECLTRVVQAIQSVLRRTTDRVTRYGGEEFAVVLPDTSAGKAFQLAESMRTAVEDLAIPNPGSGKPFLSISVGVATFEQNGTAEGLSADAVVEVADQALYQAKLRGRNRCVLMERKSQPQPAFSHVIQNVS